uniref:Uncharacterized protein n=1 Tax=Avena sativa TaxID=4498 RepID=A0ACD5WAX2_AVESA
MEFVVGASEATMRSLLGKLGGLLAQEYTLIRGVRGDIQYINDELATMQAFLVDLGSTPDGGHDCRLKDWMKQIRDMAYDMEDCIDDFRHRLPHESLNDAKCCFVIVMRLHELWTFRPRRVIASRIADLRVRAQQIADRRGRYGVNNPTQSIRNGKNSEQDFISEDRMATRRLICTEEPVGVKEDMKRLGGCLTKHGKETGRVVLSLVGFGGVGKTTIATALYRDLRNEFDFRASVAVSQNYDQEAILRDILGQIKPQDSKQEQQQGSNDTGNLEKKSLLADIKFSLKQAVAMFSAHRQRGNNDSSQSRQNKILQLVAELRRRLNGKRYLLLIDDIWSAETWDNIRNWLPHDNTEQSRIIVTTRFQAVGAACSERDMTDYLHTVGVLSDVESENLFHQAVSEAESSTGNQRLSTGLQAVGMLCSEENSTGHTHTVDCLTDADFKSIFGPIGVSDSKRTNGNKIWKFCGGLPLAIVTVAGLVACNPTKRNDHWCRVSKLFFPEQAAPLTLDGVTRILDYCYNDLPADLKTCSLYLSIFPKGSVISQKRLTRRWVSECFVTEKQGKTAEEVAETYFNQLIRRKIIRPVEHSSNGKVKSFKVHDMILEYIVSKSSEENFITVVGGHWLMPTPSNKVRRLSVQSSGSKDDDLTKRLNLSQVRSLTVFGNQNRLHFHSFNNGIIQVLDLDGWKGLEGKHLNDICKMVVLKYLSLRRTEVREIPSNIDKLEYLETLDIRETDVKELPKSFGKLKRLRSMLGGSKKPRKALKLPQERTNEAMKALRILSGIEITEDDSAAVASLHQLTGLRKLAIYKLNIQEGNNKALEQLVSSIEYLCGCGLQTLAINDEGSEFINSLDSMRTPPRYLIALELSGKMKMPPKWIKNLNNLYKLTLSVTVLKTDTFKLIQCLPKLFSLTFTLSAKKDDRDIVDILEENKQLTGREVVVPPNGFTSLKLLRFFSTTVIPRLSFADTDEPVMPALERIDMEFQAFEGIYGIENLESLKELHLSVGNQADEITKFLVDDLKDTTKFFNKKDTSKWPKIITD